MTNIMVQTLLVLLAFLPLANAQSAPPRRCKAVAITAAPAVIAPAYTPAPAQLARWQTNMATYGAQHCEHLAAVPTDLDATYYDGQRVYWMAYDYTWDPAWLTCAERAERIYRDGYVLPNNGKIPGYWIFTDGLTTDALRTGDATSALAVHLLATNGDFAPDTAYNNNYMAGVDGSRENAYVLTAYLDDEKLGQPLNPRVHRLAGFAKGHIKTWVSCKAQTVKPFMVALTAKALIQYQERTGDPEVLPYLIAAADWLWSNTWLGTYQAFAYCNAAGYGACNTDPAPDLNLLIAPVYGWLWRQTSLVRFLDRGDLAFNGGVLGAWLGTSKHFNQNYIWARTHFFGR